MTFEVKYVHGDLSRTLMEFSKCTHNGTVETDYPCEKCAQNVEKKSANLGQQWIVVLVHEWYVAHREACPNPISNCISRRQWPVGNEACRLGYVQSWAGNEYRRLCVEVMDGIRALREQFLWRTDPWPEWHKVCISRSETIATCNKSWRKIEKRLYKEIIHK